MIVDVIILLFIVKKEQFVSHVSIVNTIILKKKVCYSMNKVQIECIFKHSKSGNSSLVSTVIKNIQHIWIKSHTWQRWIGMRMNE